MAAPLLSRHWVILVLFALFCSAPLLVNAQGTQSVSVDATAVDPSSSCVVSGKNDGAATGVDVAQRSTTANGCGGQAIATAKACDSGYIWLKLDADSSGGPNGGAGGHASADSRQSIIIRPVIPKGIFSLAPGTRIVIDITFSVSMIGSPYQGFAQAEFSTTWSNSDGAQGHPPPISLMANGATVVTRRFRLIIPFHSGHGPRSVSLDVGAAATGGAYSPNSSIGPTATDQNGYPLHVQISEIVTVQLPSGWSQSSVTGKCISRPPFKQ
jgi:hypothetical protein